MPQFHETPQGQEFYRVQFPLLIKAIAELAKAEKDLANEVYKLTEELKRRGDP